MKLFESPRTDGGPPGAVIEFAGPPGAALELHGYPRSEGSLAGWLLEDGTALGEVEAGRQTSTSRYSSGPLRGASLRAHRRARASSGSTRPIGRATASVGTGETNLGTKAVLPGDIAPVGPVKQRDGAWVGGDILTHATFAHDSGWNVVGDVLEGVEPGPETEYTWSVEWPLRAPLSASATGSP